MFFSHMLIARWLLQAPWARARGASGRGPGPLPVRGASQRGPAAGSGVPGTPDRWPRAYHADANALIKPTYTGTLNRYEYYDDVSIICVSMLDSVCP